MGPVSVLNAMVTRLTISADARRSLFLSAMRAVMTALAVLAGTPAFATVS